MVRLVFGMLGVMTVSGCVWETHDVPITATAPSVQSSAGAGVSLSLQVIDDRDSLEVGQRAARMEGADIIASGIMPALERQLKAGFEAHGFRVLPANTKADTEVEARLRAFKFFLQTGMLQGTANTSAVVAIEAERSGEDYDRTYRSAIEDPSFWGPDEKDIDAQLNQSFASVLGQITTDGALIGFLSGGPSLVLAQPKQEVLASAQAEKAEAASASRPAAAKDPCANFIKGQDRTLQQRLTCE